MLHNARFTIIFHEKVKPLRIYLHSYGAPENVKRLVHLACRGKRRQVVQDPEMLAVNLMWQAGKRTQVNFSVRGDPLWTYIFHLLDKKPSVTITNPSNGISEKVALFDWLGPERRKQIKPRAGSPAVHSSGSKRRRGRPSQLQDPRIAHLMKDVRIPVRVDPVLGPIYEETLPDQTKQSTPLHSPKARKKVRIS